MKLYFAPGYCSQAVHIALREAGCDADLVQVDTVAGTTTDGSDYRAINPRGYVPLLELDDGSRHTEVAALTLVSHKLCPYVQRAAIVLLEKGVPFSRRWVDLAHKPDWFTAMSPLGKTPVLLTEGEAIFESAVICEYLDEAFAPRLHPAGALQRARHRAWMEFGSSLLATIASYYNAADAAALEQHRQLLRTRFRQLDQVLNRSGPYFAGTAFCMVDAVLAPAFRYFDTFEAIGQRGFFDLAPRVQDWRRALLARPSVQQAVVSDYQERLLDFVRARGSELSRRVAATSMA